jgi:hypothetical protein
MFILKDSLFDISEQDLLAVHRFHRPLVHRICLALRLLHQAGENLIKPLSYSGTEHDVIILK